MDVLGKEGEQAAEAVQNLSQRLEDLESHLNAVDSAVQDNSETTRELAQKNRQRVAEIEEMLVELTEIQKNSMKEIDVEDGKEARLEKKVDALKEKLRRMKENQEEIETRLEKLDRQLNRKMGKIEKKVFRTEDELTQEIELNTGRIGDLSDVKVDRKTHEDDIQELKKDISKLRTSVNALATELEDENIRVE
ncbi:MAG: hypothetical protein ABEK16_04840 [Candidatus Nanohalobium sp.]